MAYASTERRLFGVASARSLLVAAAVLLAGAVAALVTGSWPLAVLLFALAAALLVLFVGTEEQATSTARRVLVTTGVRARGWIRFAGDSLAAWARAGRGVAGIAPELRRLRRERAATQLELGDAAYREDAARTAELRDRMHALDDTIAERETARAELLARARRRVQDERLAVRPTEIRRPEEAPPGDEESTPGG